VSRLDRAARCSKSRSTDACRRRYQEAEPPLSQRIVEAQQVLDEVARRTRLEPRRRRSPPDRRGAER
jgi:hypothetical protein